MRDRVDPALVVLGGAQGRAVIIVAAPVPLAVPSLLQHAGEAPGLVAVALGACLVAPPPAERGELAQDTVEEEAQPHALPASFPSHAVHAVVPVSAPHERKPVGAHREPFVDGAEAMFEERSLFGRDVRPAVGVERLRSEDRGFQKRHRRIEHARVARRPNVVRHRIGKPEQVVGAAGACAPAARLVPPVLDIAFEELPARGPQEVFPEQIRPRQRKRHDVLKLVSKPEGPARLVIGRSGPQPAAHVLIEKPAVHQQVEGIVRRADLNRIEDRVPASAHGFEGGIRGVHRAESAHQLAGVVEILPLADEESNAARLPRSQGDGYVQRCARIESRSETPRQRLAAKSRRLRQRAVAPEERQAVSRCRDKGLACVREGHTARELSVVRVPGQDRPGRCVVLGDHVSALAGAWWPQGPLVVGEHGQTARPSAFVGEREQRELHRVRRIDKHVEVLAYAVRHAGEAGKPGGVPDDEATARGRTAHRARRGRPRLACFVVAKEDRLGRGVGHGVVREGRETVLAAVLRPGVGRPRGRDHRPERRVGDDIGPGKGRLLVRFQDDHVVAPVVGESAHAVGQHERRHGHLRWQ